MQKSEQAFYARLPKERPSYLSDDGWAILQERAQGDTYKTIALRMGRRIDYVRSRDTRAQRQVEEWLRDPTPRSTALKDRMAVIDVMNEALAGAPVGARRALQRADYLTVDAIDRATDAELLAVAGFGSGSLAAVRQVLSNRTG